MGTENEQSEAALRLAVSTMQDDMQDIKTSISKIADAVSRLAVLEDRQSAQMSLQTKILERIESLEARQHATELRLVTGALTMEKVADVGNKVNDLALKVNSMEVERRTATSGIKAAWAVFGGAISAGLLWFFTGGK